MDNAVKFVDGHDDLIEGMLAPFGGTDLTGEHFTPETEFELGWFGPWERPLLYAHGTDPALKTSVVGRMSLTQTDKGIWMQAQLDKSHAYKDAVAQLVHDGALGLSAGSIERFYWAGRDTRSGAIKHFPIIEGSLTPSPAHPEALLAPYAAKSVDAIEHLAVIGIEAPDQLTVEAVKEVVTVDVVTETTEDTNIEPITRADVDSIHEAIKSLQEAVTALVKASEPEPAPPEQLLAIAGKSLETDEPVDLDALREEMTALAIKEAKALLG